MIRNNNRFNSFNNNAMNQGLVLSPEMSLKTTDGTGGSSGVGTNNTVVDETDLTFDVKKFAKLAADKGLSALWEILDKLFKAGVISKPDDKRTETPPTIFCEYEGVGYTFKGTDADKVNKSDTNTNDETNGFKTYYDLRNYMFGSDGLRQLVKSQIKDWNNNIKYETVAERVAGRHTTDYASLTKEAVLKEFIDEYKTMETESKTENSDFKTYADLRNYLFSNRELVKAQIKNWKANIQYEVLCEKVSARHKEDYYLVTKDQLIKEMVNEYKSIDPDVSTKPNRPSSPFVASKMFNLANGEIQMISSAVSQEPSEKEEEKPNTSSYKDIAAEINSHRGRYAENMLADTVADTSNPENNPKFQGLLRDIKQDLKNKGLLDKIGEDTLKALLKNAWCSCATSKNMPVNSFVESVIAKLCDMLENLAEHPENLDILTADYTGIELKDEGSVRILKGDYLQYYDGIYHLDSEEDDKILQQAVKNVLKQIYDMYPNVDKAMLKEKFGIAMQWVFEQRGGGNTYPNNLKYNSLQGNSISDLMQNIIWAFGKIMLGETTFPTINETSSDVQPKYSETDMENIKSASGDISSIFDNIAKSGITSLSAAEINKKEFHTEFGMDEDGNIVFQDTDAKKVFDKIVASLKDYLQRFANNALEKLLKASGMSSVEELLKRLVQTAWITTYNDFDSSQKNNVVDFVNKVTENLSNMFKKLQKNPEYLEFFTGHTSYTDKNVIKHPKNNEMNLSNYGSKTTYGDDETIAYNRPYTESDGTVHLGKIHDDKDYQVTMEQLLHNLIQKYQRLPEETVTQVFRDAQAKALQAMIDRKFDCPYGTGNNSGRVEDGNDKNWGGKDNRGKDNNKIDMDQLVQMTLYYFDKLIYKELLK